MQVVLVMFRGEGERRSFSIVRDVTVIGRREDCDFRIPLGEISRKHCRLIKDGDSFRAEDLGSSNGTYVNGARVQEAELSPGDTLKVGSVIFVVQIDGLPAEADMQPASDVLSDTGVTMAAPEEDDLLSSTPEAHGDPHGDPDRDVSAAAADEPTLDDETPSRELAVETESDQYDPMSILAADPDASSLGSALDSDHIAGDLLIELESKEQRHAKPQD